LKIAELMSIFGIAPVNQAVLNNSLSHGISDFEDAVLHESALQADSFSSCAVGRVIFFWHRHAMKLTPCSDHGDCLFAGCIEKKDLPKPSPENNDFSVNAFTFVDRDFIKKLGWDKRFKKKCGKTG